MHCTHYDINFDLNKMMNEELPYTQAFYRQAPGQSQAACDAAFYKDVHDYFDFTLKNSRNMPVYELPLSACAEIETTFENAYAMLVEAVGKLFALPDAEVMKYMGCAFLRRHPYFLDYARFTYRDVGSARQAIYGRFDATLNPDTNQVEGIYEFNGDTPTMLFEAVSQQNMICETLTGDNFLQLNSFYPTLQELIRNMGAIPGTAAVICDHNTFEDVATSEVIQQILGEENECMFADITEMDYDFTNRSNPFVIGDTPASVIFALLPWEEMIESMVKVAPHAFKEWTNWGQHVTFLEPAWRWFASNKGIWAFITHLIETDEDFRLRYENVPVLPTYLNNQRFLQVGEKFVSKPKIGRMSNNITIFNADGSHNYSTDGAYDGDDVVYQMYAPPFQVPGRNNFIIGMFMVPDVSTNYVTMRESTAATLCIREFESPTLSWKNERFIPHILIDDIEDEDDDEEEYL
ncbi:glutathionylspermidine synthase [Pseudomonas phage Lu11]|uniref:glutathionylspermidine synthase n=1 Tax=Pseudomonas phage Lu11 TaxID=1161927 RepID=UPI00025F183C|nr:glutathionylspermidine synthase [Pseudomonas phage Lu11]AFH14808.1 putative glutathionyl spermidine synthase [Pseudomonas phage Lu11]